MQANAWPTDDTITVAPGIDPTISIDDDDVDDGGDLDVRGTVTIDGQGATVEAAGLDRGFQVHSGVVTLEHLEVRGGSAVNGGGILLTAGSLELRDATIAANSGVKGAGLHQAGGQLDVQRSTIVGNVASNGQTGAAQGGGLYQAAGTATIENTTLGGNHADDFGGGVQALGTVVVRSSTFVDNFSLVGSGLSRTGAGAISIAATALDDVDDDCSSTMTSAGYNLSSDASCAIAGVGDATDVVLLMGALDDNGGATHTALPFANSPVVDAIPAGTASLCNGTLPTDQRGAARPSGAGCDIGAVEGHSSEARTPLSLVVDSPNDAPDAVPGDGLCSTASSSCTLRAAIDESNAWAAHDQIAIAPGVDPVLAIGGGGEDLNASGDLDATDVVTIEGNGATIDAAGIDRAVHGVHERFTLAEMTVTGGLVASSGGGILAEGDGASVATGIVATGNTAASGGGIAATMGGLQIADSLIHGNGATGSGGGVAVEGAGVVVTGTIVESNTSTTPGGGLLLETGTLAIIESIVSGNGTVGVTQTGGALAMTGATVDSNTGGGVRVEAGTATLTETAITGNTALLAAGLSIVDLTSDGLEPTVSVYRSTIAGNATTGSSPLGHGGGVYMDTGDLVIEDSTISGNSAVGATGAGIKVSSGNSVTIRNSTISGNTAQSAAGVSIGQTGPVLVASSTIVGNVGGSLTGDMTLKGSIVSGTGSDCGNFTEITSGGYNLLSDTSCAVSGPGDQQGVVPLLEPLADNGGPTRTRLAYANSPSVDVIPVGTVGLCDVTVPDDQRGAPRPSGAACDIGAVEGTNGAPAAPLALVVDTATDANDTEPGDGTCATAGGGCTLRAAVDETNAWPTADSITIDAGVDPVLAISGAGDDANQNGDLDISDDLTLDGAGATVDADSIDRVVHIISGDVEITDITLTGGQATTGGGLRNEAGVLELTSTTVNGNHATGSGGGIYLAGGTLTGAGVVISGNSADASGGGIYQDRNDVTLTSSTITANNAVVSGGGLVVVRHTVALSNVAVTANTASGPNAKGGGIQVVNGTLELTDSTVSGNMVSATGTVPQGGGIHEAFGNLFVLRSTLSGNTATVPTLGALGAGFYQQDGSATFTLSTISGNTTAGSFATVGGGMYTRGTTTVTLSTIKGNAAVFSAGLHRAAGSLTVRGSLLENSGKSCGSAVGAPIVSGGYNAVADATCTAFTQTGDLQNATLLLGALASNGGPTLTHLPGAGSPAINAIPNGTANLCVAAVNLDQRGITRPTGAACDRGAVEQ
jgi:hypothetical protein